MATENWGLIWALVGLLIVALECIGLGAGQAPWTLSATMRMIRFDPVGRFILLPLWTWLTLHWLIAPKWLGTRPDWRSVIALSIGILWAIWDAHR